MTIAPAHRDRLLAALRGVRARVAKGWTKHAAARDALGIEVSTGAEAAERFCLIGATIRTTTEIALREGPPKKTDSLVREGLYVATESRIARAALALFPHRLPGAELHPQEVIQEVNDHAQTDQADALAIVDRAIAGVEAAS